MGILGPLLAARESSNASDQASQTQAQSAAASTAEQQRQFDLTRSDLAPYRQAGYGALNRLTNASTGNMSDFFTSPDYNFTRSEGTRDIGNSFAARGGAASGNDLRALSQFNQGLAAGQYGDWWNRQAGLAGVGQSATNTSAAAGQNAANNISSINMNAANLIGQNTIAGGNARASAINQANQGGQNFLGYLWGNNWRFGK